MNVMLVSYALLGFPFIEMLRKYLAHFLNSHSFDWNFTVSLTFSIFSTDEKGLCFGRNHLYAYENSH